MWGRTTIAAEDFWAGTIGEVLSFESSETDIFYTLFPEAYQSAKGNKRYYLEQSNISNEDFIGYKRMTALGAVCACAYMDNPEIFNRFEFIVSVAKDARTLVADFASNGIDARGVTIACVRSFLGQDLSALPNWAREGSETFGPLSAANESRKAIIIQAGVMFGFLINYYQTSSTPVAEQLIRSPGDSRDKMALFLAFVQRLQSNILTQFKIS